MGTTWINHGESQPCQSLPNRSSRQDILNALRTFRAHNPEGVVIDVAYNPAKNPASGSLVLVERFKLYQEAGISNVVVVTRVNSEQVEELDHLCKSAQIRAIHLPNMVVGMAILNRWLHTASLTFLRSATIFNEFHAEKPTGPSEGAIMLESTMRSQNARVEIKHEHKRTQVPYRNYHGVTLTGPKGELSVMVKIDHRESSISSMKWMSDNVRSLEPGFHVNITGLAKLSQTPLHENGIHLSDNRDQLCHMLHDNGYVRRPSKETNAIAYWHPVFHEEVSIKFKANPNVCIGTPNPQKEAVTVVGSGPVGAFTAYFVAEHLHLPVKWVTGTKSPAAESSSQNLHLDIIFQRNLNGEMYNVKTLAKDILNPNSGVDLGQLTPGLVWNGLKSFYFAQQEGQDSLSFSKQVGTIVKEFWNTETNFKPAVTFMPRPQLATFDSEPAMRGLFKLLHSRGAAVYWEDNISTLSQLIGQPLGPNVVGGIIHESSANGQLDIYQILNIAKHAVLKQGGQLLPFDADLSTRMFNTNMSRVQIKFGPSFESGAIVYATGSWTKGTIPLIGATATLYGNYGINCPLTIGRFTFSSVWENKLRFTSGVGINTNRDELSLKLVRNLAHDIYQTVPELAEKTGVRGLLDVLPRGAGTHRVQHKSFIYKFDRDETLLKRISILDCNDTVIADITTCPGRPFRAESVPQHHWNNTTIYSPATNMAGLNWGPFSGLANARLVQKALKDTQGISTPKLPWIDAVEGKFPIPEGEKGSWPT